MNIKTVADLRKTLEQYPDDMLVLGWNDDMAWFHELAPEVRRASPVRIEWNGNVDNGFVDADTMEYKEHPDPEHPDYGCYDYLTRLGPDIEVLDI